MKEEANPEASSESAVEVRIRSRFSLSITNIGIG